MARVVTESVSDSINNHLHDPRVEGLSLISITEVRMTADLKNAHVYVSIMSPGGGERKIFSAIEHGAGYIQALLGKRITSKFCPHLSFHLDDRLKHTAETMKAIDEVVEQPDDVEEETTENNIGDAVK